MDDNQKRIISRTFQVLLFIISIVFLILSIVYSTIEPNGRMWVWFGFVSSFLTPSTLIGFWLKKWLNDTHKKEVQQILNQIPQEMLKNSKISTSKQQKVSLSVNIPKNAKTLLKWNEWEVYNYKKTIMISYANCNFRNDEDFVNQLRALVNEVSEVCRKAKMTGDE